MVEIDAAPSAALGTFKSHAARRLNAAFGPQKWWTTSGSTRLLPDERAVRAATRYVRDKARPLVAEVDPAWLPAE